MFQLTEIPQPKCLYDARFFMPTNSNGSVQKTSQLGKGGRQDGHDDGALADETVSARSTRKHKLISNRIDLSRIFFGTRAIGLFL